MRNQRFHVFENSFRQDFSISGDGNVQGDSILPSDLRVLFSHYPGTSWNQGIYRILKPAEVSVWSARVREAFPEFHRQHVPFAFDWLGRVFAASTEMEAAHFVSKVFIFSILTDEVLEIPSSVESFHDVVLIENREAALEVALFERFIQQNHIETLPYDRCVGMSTPLFLGGTYSLENMEVEAIDTYWAITTQILFQVRGMADGESVRTVVTKNVS